VIFERTLFLRDSPGFERLSFSRDSVYKKLNTENGVLAGQNRIIRRKTCVIRYSPVGMIPPMLCTHLISLPLTIYTGLFKMIVGVLTSCHTQYTSFSRCNPMWFLSMGLRQRSGLCSYSSRKYLGRAPVWYNKNLEFCSI